MLAVGGLDLDVALHPILLLPEQCEHYRLPRTPLKETERRGAKFEARFGTGATELDALEAIRPGELARIVQREVCRYLDPTLNNRVRQAEHDLDRGLAGTREEILDRFEIEHLTDRYDALRNEILGLDRDFSAAFESIAHALEGEMPAAINVPEPRPAEPIDEPLFDSKRDYLSQIDAYRAWQGRGTS
jgi:hypothetical protein